MICQFERLLYPQDIRMVNPSSYMVAVYRPCGKLLDNTGGVVKQFKAVGYCLPICENLRYDFQGQWNNNSKHGLQFEVDTYDEVINPTKAGIVAYLASGQIKGIGHVLAERIYDAFGNKALDVLDKEPEKLLTIAGISEGKLKKICESYLANRGARDVVAFLAPHGITANRAVKLYREYGNKTMEIVQKHPYRLSEMAGIGFLTADKIAASMGFGKLSTERVDAGILYTLADAEGKGHLCLEKHAFVKACLKMLDTAELTEEMVANRALRLVSERKLECYLGNVYLSKTARAERCLSELIGIHLRTPMHYAYDDLEAELIKEENALHINLAPEQRDAIKTALTQKLSIITGGPGTGKTLIQRAILNIYRRNNPHSEICCCAPTGRAARRMEQSTGFSASTVHKALGLIAGEDGKYTEPRGLEADLIIVDEVSMLDIYLANFLFEAVKTDSQIVLIGDADQLPSVGPGAVLSELIASERIPVVRLDRVFRQNAGSRIATNAKLIRHGNLNLEYGEDFRFVDSPDTADASDRITSLYMQETARCGIDNVALLSPYRQKTETGVNALNERIREIVNPPGANKPEIANGKKLFRLGDKVMQVKNHEDVNNGDIGYITKILKQSEETTVRVDFGDGRIAEYDASELDMLDLGYASTIHKAQGGEFNTVLINIQCAHAIMLTRPLVYTAITRGKDRVIIVGERKALCIAIKRTDTEKRGTCLAERLRVQTKN